MADSVALSCSLIRSYTVYTFCILYKDVNLCQPMLQYHVQAEQELHCSHMAYLGYLLLWGYKYKGVHLQEINMADFIFFVGYIQVKCEVLIWIYKHISQYKNYTGYVGIHALFVSKQDIFQHFNQRCVYLLHQISPLWRSWR